MRAWPLTILECPTEKAAFTMENEPSSLGERRHENRDGAMRWRQVDLVRVIESRRSSKIENVASDEGLHFDTCCKDVTKSGCLYSGRTMKGLTS
jgi:hypothetical protein